MVAEDHGFDFHGATFDLTDPHDLEMVRFILSQALFGEATGVYCGKSLYAARSLEAAEFYLRQARQELNHLKLFAQIFRILDLQPMEPHWVIKLLSSHNNYYPLKVLMEHAIGEGMVHDIFKDVLLQTLPDDDPRVPEIKKKLRSICREEVEHVAWGEKETKYFVKTRPWLKWPFYGLVEMQIVVAPIAARSFGGSDDQHPVLKQLPAFIGYVQDRIRAQSTELGFYPEKRPNLFTRTGAMIWGAALYVRSQFARSTSTLDKTYLSELGFNDGPSGDAGLEPSSSAAASG